MLKALIKRLLMVAQVVRCRDNRQKVVFYHDVGTQYTPMGTEEKTFWQHVGEMERFERCEKCERCERCEKCERCERCEKCERCERCEKFEKCERDGEGLRSLRSVRGLRGAVVCFDDGFRGIWDWREEFRKRKLTPIVFVAIRLVGQPGYLTWDEIRMLQNEYSFRFECHTWSHQTLAGEMIDESPIEERTKAWFHRELVESKAELERQLDRPVTALCFPVGNFSDEVVERCRAAGYQKVYASYPGNVTDEYIQPRNLVQDCSPFDFKLVLNGGLMAFYGRYYARHKGLRG